MDYHQPESEFQPRSYISAISEIVLDESETCDGRAKQTMGEARMDIVSSEMAYLGYQDSEAYGLSWKVIHDPHTRPRFYKGYTLPPP